MKMKTSIKTIFCHCIIGLFFCFHFAVSNAQNSDDSLRIINSSLDYIEGWYEGNPQRLKQSLHKKLAKRQISSDPATGMSRITHINDWQLTMIAKLSGGGSRVPENEWNISIQILDISGNTASVKVASRDFTEFLHLAREIDKWVIVNIIWEPISMEPPGNGFNPLLILLVIILLIISPFVVWPARYIIRQKREKGESGNCQSCADRRLVSRINLLLSILFIGLFFIYGGWLLYIICILSIPNMLWSNWINWREKFWSFPGRIYYSMLSSLILIFDFLILLQFNIL
jgi:hypothetical protein